MSALDYTLDDQALPATFVCHACQGALTVYPDIHGGEWVHCAGCQFAGDLIELAMRDWQLDLVSTIRKLHARKVPLKDYMREPDIIAKYEFNILNHRRRIQDFWRVASQTPIQDNLELLRMHDQLGMTSHYEPERWARQMRPFIGWSTRYDIEKSMRPYSTIKQPSGRDRIFVGSGWRGMLCLPFYDLPGRISAFWFAGRELDWANDWVFRLARVRTNGRDSAFREAGVGFYHALGYRHPRFGDSVFVVQDPRIAIQLHSRWFKDNSTQLPLICAYEGVAGYTKGAWAVMPKRDWVFWAAAPTRELFVQAAEVNGRVFIEPVVPEADFKHYTTWLNKVKESARPWEDVLEDNLARMDDAKVEELVLNLRLKPLEWDDMLSRRAPKARERLTLLSNKQYPVKTIGIAVKGTGMQRIQENHNGWFFDNGDCISDAIIRIVETNHVDPNRMFHRIHVRYKDKLYEFNVPFRIATYRLGDAVENALARAGVGVPRFNPFWKSKLYELAKRFHRPIMVPGPEDDPAPDGPIPLEGPIDEVDIGPAVEISEGSLP